MKTSTLTFTRIRISVSRNALSLNDLVYAAEPTGMGVMGTIVAQTKTRFY